MVGGGLTKLSGQPAESLSDSNQGDTMARSPSPAVRRLGRIAALVLLAIAAQQCSAQYYGKLIGKLSSFHHGVSGEVYAVDARTLFIKDFNYDGDAPAAWFYAGNSKTIGVNGFKIRDEQGTLNPLRRYRKKDITLTLPEGKTLNNIKWISVWCEEFAVNFGDVKIPRNFEHPRPQKLAGLSGIHGVNSEPVVVVDAQTLLLPSFSYDGEAPDAKFWVGSGPSPSPQGIRVPDENGKEVPLRRYDRKTIVLTLPGELTIHQLGHFGVWCEAFAVDFGHVQIPQSLNVPPSLKMLGVSPQNGRVNLVQILSPDNTRPRNTVQEASSQQHQHARQFLQQYDLRPTTYRPVLQRRTEAPSVQVVPALDYQAQQLYTADGLVTRLHQLRANVQDDGDVLGGYVTPLAQKRFQGGLIRPAQAHARFQQLQDGRGLEAYHVQY